MKLQFDEVSPITGEKSVLVEKDSKGKTYKVCTQSGYVMNPEYKVGGALHKLLGFLDDTYTKFTEGDEVVDPWNRLPTAMLRDRVVDRNGDVWLPATQYTNKWCLHPTVHIKDGQTPRWGISPVIEITADGSKPAEGLLATIGESFATLNFSEPSYHFVAMAPHSESSNISYFFADFTKARWYDSYGKAYEAFANLNLQHEQ